MARSFAKFTTGNGSLAVKIDSDQLPLGAQTGLTSIADADNVDTTQVGTALEEGQLLRVAVRYGTIGSARPKRALILMTLQEVGKGSIKKLVGKTFKGGTILSAKIPQTAIDS